MSKQNLVLFIFRRDLRLEDNLPLQEALNFAGTIGAELLPVFIFTPQQVGKAAPVKSTASVSCLLQSLEELDEALHSRYKSGLCILYDDNIKALTKLKKNSKYNISSIFQTKDYTPFAKYREEDETKFCEENGIEYHSIDYLYMHPPGSILNGSGKPYQKFTPFYNATEKLKVPKPQGWVEGEFQAQTEKERSSLARYTHRF
jgi:deoxyribodipyrimidine photo-lyase